MASEQNCIEIRVRKIHDGEWIWKNNVWCPRKNEEYFIWISVVNSDILTSGTEDEMIEFLSRWGFDISVVNIDILTSGTEDEMIEFLSRWGFDYVPGKVYYGR